MSSQEAEQTISVGPYQVSFSLKQVSTSAPPVFTYTHTTSSILIEIFQPFRFLDLPAEVHAMVYRELFQDSHVTVTEDSGRPNADVDTSHYHPDIVIACRDLHTEAEPYLLETNRLIVRGTSSTDFWGRCKFGLRLGHPVSEVKHLSISNTFRDFEGLPVLNPFPGGVKTCDICFQTPRRNESGEVLDHYCVGRNLSSFLYSPEWEEATRSTLLHVSPNVIRYCIKKIIQHCKQAEAAAKKGLQVQYVIFGLGIDDSPPEEGEESVHCVCTKYGVTVKKVKITSGSVPTIELRNWVWAGNDGPSERWQKTSERLIPISYQDRCFVVTSKTVSILADCGKIYSEVWNG